jgi:hypothetical protein
MEVKRVTCCPESRRAHGSHSGSRNPGDALPKTFKTGKRPLFDLLFDSTIWAQTLGQAHPIA